MIYLIRISINWKSGRENESKARRGISYVFKEPVLDKNGIVTEKIDKYSHIYLIRLQLKQCMRCNPGAITWPIARTVIAGIDALGLYWKGGTDVSSTGFYKTTAAGFKEFCKDWLNLNPASQNALYQLRCAFLHTASLISMEESSGDKYIFSFYYESEKEMNLIEQTTENRSGHKVIKCKINLFKLYSEFEKAVINFRDGFKNATIPEFRSTEFLKIYEQIQLMVDE